MSISSIALALKKFRQRFGIAAPRVTIRSHVGWQWYAAGLAVLATLIAVIAWSLARQGDASELGREVRELRDQLGEKDAELMRLRVGAATEQNAVQMERSAQQQLVARIKVLEGENASLKEDVSLFERLVKDCPRKPGTGRHN